MKSSTRNGVLLSGYFGCGNLGDDLLLSAAVAGLRAAVPGAQFLVRDGGDIAQVNSRGTDVLFTGIERVLADNKNSKPYRLMRYLTQMAKMLRRCRWLIFAGGTVFHEHNQARSLIIQWAICRLARLFNVRIAALGVGISALPSALGRRLVRDIVRMSELFLVRDEAARKIAGGTARVTGDLVFDWRELVSLSTILSRSAAGGPRTIALAVCPSAFQGASEQRAVAAFSEAARIWHSHGHRLVFLVFQKGDKPSADQHMFGKITAQLGKDISADTRILAASPQALAASYRDVDLLCGMRFHGFVLATLFGIPFVGVAHENKISEICRRFDMACLDAKTFDGAELAQTVEMHLDRRPDPVLVERSSAEAHENFRAFAELAA
jgi:polysaccharide pyruvyl transferase WcaK-like protein